MATTQDFTDTLKDMMGAWQMDQSKFEEAWKSSTGFGEKASGIALDAAGKTTDISVGWTMETLGRMGDLAKARTAPTDYAQAMSDFATAQMESAKAHMTALGDVAKEAHSETMSLMMSLGKDMADDATAAATTTAKATEKAAEKATTAATSAARTTTRRTTAAAKKTAAETAEVAETVEAAAKDAAPTDTDTTKS